jgi:hypothetical protein
MGLYGFIAICGVLLLVAAVMSDRLTKKQALERIMAADEPCRAAYTKVVELEDGGALKAGEAIEAARAGEPVCRASFKQLDDINIFIPRGASEARDKKAAIDDCAALSRARADLLAYAAGAAKDQARLQTLTADLERADGVCQRSFASLAR